MVEINFSPVYSILLALLVAMLVMLLLAWISLKLATKYKILDLPGAEPHKRHDTATPVAGGIAIMITLFISERYLGLFAGQDILACFLAAIPVLAFGVWDDIKHSKPHTKLFGQIIGTFLLIRLGIYIQIFESPEFFFPLSHELRIALDWLITVFWVVGITNAFNFVDSKDGLAVGLGGLASAFFILMTLDSDQILLSQHSAVILGACIGLYFFNSPPAVLFMGDSGSQTLGFLLASLAIAYDPQGASQFSSWIVPIMILGVPIFDTALVVISRLRRNKPVYIAGLDHTYHRLFKLKIGSHRSVLVMQFAALVLGCIAFIILNQPPLIANFIFFIILIAGLVILFMLDSPDFWDSQDSGGKR